MNRGAEESQSLTSTERVLKGQKGDRRMKALTLNEMKISSMVEREGIGEADIRMHKSSSWGKRFLGQVKASFSGPFESDWDKKCGLHWREWGKL